MPLSFFQACRSRATYIHHIPAVHVRWLGHLICDRPRFSSQECVRMLQLKWSTKWKKIIRHSVIRCNNWSQKNRNFEKYFEKNMQFVELFLQSVNLGTNFQERCILLKLCCVWILLKIMRLFSAEKLRKFITKTQSSKSPNIIHHLFF